MKKTVKRLFWDTNIGDKDIKAHPDAIIERILEEGDEEAVRWMTNTFDRRRIIKNIAASPRISERSKNYWRVLFHIPWQKKSKPSSAKTRSVAWQR